MISSFCVAVKTGLAGCEGMELEAPSVLVTGVAVGASGAVENVSL
jgi:hypothetical protein